MRGKASFDCFGYGKAGRVSLGGDRCESVRWGTIWQVRIGAVRHVAFGLGVLFCE